MSIAAFVRRGAIAGAVLGAATIPLACKSDANPGTASAGAIDVVASFYPLQYVAQRVGGDHIDVSNLTPSGAEPHELELTADDTAALADADLVVYLSGFAPSVDDGVADVAGGHALDVADAADLTLTYTPIEEGEMSTADAGSRDPHFWLDPTRLAAVADAVASRLGNIDPDHADEYTANTAALGADLARLDDDYRSGLTGCAARVIVTSHNAFGYLAARYGLTQLGITGLTPEDEPSPGDLAAVSDFVETHHVTTIYYETLVSPKIAETVAAETGAHTAVLDPIEGLSKSSAGSDYLAVMRANLATLRAGQGCP